MTPDLYWINGPWTGRLAISARPRGGDWLEDEIRGLRDADINVIVSLLEAGEADELGLTKEKRFAESQDIEFISFPIADRGVPGSLPGFVSLLQRLADMLKAGENIAVHCRQGLGRSALISAGLLIGTGVDLDGALQSITSARGVRVPERDRRIA